MFQRRRSRRGAGCGMASAAAAATAAVLAFAGALRLSGGLVFASGPARVKMVPGRRALTLVRATEVEAAPATEEKADQDQKPVMPELLDFATAAQQGGEAEKKALEERVDEAFPQISSEDIAELQTQLGSAQGEEGAAVQLLGESIQGAVERRMGVASQAIAEIIDNADGDVHIGVRKLLKKAESPLPVLMVLQLNIQQAQTEGQEDRMRALMHIYTVINEELEKKAPKVSALLNKLMRLEDPGIRLNLLRHHLTPVEVGAAPSFDDDDDSPPLMAAMVSPSKLAAAISQFVGNVDAQLKMAGTSEEDENMRYESLDQIREIAKEARLVVGEVHGEGAMNQFGADLTPAFTTLMAYKARTEPQPSASSSEGSSSGGGAEEESSAPAPQAPGEGAGRSAEA